MASEYLVNKWKKTFSLFDVNKDDVITEEDATIFTKNLIATYKLDETTASDLKSDMSGFWQGMFIRDVDNVTEEQFINAMTEEFSTNEEEFVRNTRKHFAVFVSTIDNNNDGLISREEFRNAQRALGVVTFHNKYFNAFPLVETGDVKSELFLESWVAFCCNNDVSDIGDLEKARLCGFRMDQDINKDTCMINLDFK